MGMMYPVELLEVYQGAMRRIGEMKGVVRWYVRRVGFRKAAYDSEHSSIRDKVCVLAVDACCWLMQRNIGLGRILSKLRVRFINIDAKRC